MLQYFRKLINKLFWAIYEYDIEQGEFTDERYNEVFSQFKGEDELKAALRSLMKRDMRKYFQVPERDGEQRSFIKGGSVRTLYILRKLKDTKKQARKKTDTKVAGRYG